MVMKGSSANSELDGKSPRRLREGRRKLKSKSPKIPKQDKKKKCKVSDLHVVAFKIHASVI